MLKIDSKVVEEIIVSYSDCDNEEEIKSFSISQEEDIQKKLEEIYNYIKEVKNFDKRQNIGKDLKYYIELQTADTKYGNYRIVKHRDNKYSMELIRS